MPDQPEPYFVRKTYPLKGSKRLIFFFVGYASKSWQYKTVYKKFHKLGYNVIAYQFPGTIVSKVDGRYTAKLREIILEDLKEQIKQHSDIEEFASFGVSMGAVYSIGMAKEVPEIKKMVMVTAYGNCAQQVWDTSVLKHMKKIYTDKGWTVADVFKAYPEIEPLVNIEKLEGKEMLLYASHDDTLIKFANTNQFIKAAKEAGLSLEVIVGHGDHFPFIVRTLLRGRRWREFLA